MQYDVNYDVCAILVLVSVILHFVGSKGIRNQKQIVFVQMVILAMLGGVCDVLSAVLNYHFNVPVAMNNLINFGYFSGVAGVALAYCFYVIILSREGTVLKFRSFLWMGFPYLILMAMCIVSPYTKWMYYYDEQKIYRHGPFFILLYVVPIVYMLVALFIAVKYRKIFRKNYVVAIFGFTVLMILLTWVQIHDTSVMVIAFGESFACMFVGYTMANPAEYYNLTLGAYNRNAFLEVFQYKTKPGRKVGALAIYAEGLDTIESILGYEGVATVEREIANFLAMYCRRKCIFKMSQGMFCVLDTKSGEEWKELQNLVRGKFQHPIPYKDTGIKVRVFQAQLKDAKKFGNADDVMNVLTYSIEKAVSDNVRVAVDADRVPIEQCRREAYVLNAVRWALENNGFSVHYQPIYSTTEGRFVRAEALLRLYDEKLGFIEPEEFIPVVEQHGLITEVGAFVFRHTCKFLAKEKLWERGIERVDINLSVLQCMQEHLASFLIDVMDAYGVPYKAINLEVTAVAAQVSDDLKINMEKLMEKGVTFSLDDFGTGNSSMVTLIKYPFEDIKLHESLIWEAMENPKAMQGLKHTIAMLTDMGFEIVAEGVENIEMAGKLQSLGCTIHQGFYYSEAMPEKEFLSILPDA